MVSIEFQFNGIPFQIQINPELPFKEAINKYLQKSSINPDSICFLANGKNINPEEAIINQMSELNKKNNKMKILIYSLDDKDKEPIIIKSKDIICPKCQEPCRIKLDDYKIKLIECSQNHV